MTGSGKTEVYLTLSEQVIALGKTVLMLVPEISLTPMMNEYFIKRFNHSVAILHSVLGKRYSGENRLNDCLFL